MGGASRFSWRSSCRHRMRISWYRPGPSGCQHADRDFQPRHRHGRGWCGAHRTRYRRADRFRRLDADDYDKHRPELRRRPVFQRLDLRHGHRKYDADAGRTRQPSIYAAGERGVWRSDYFIHRNRRRRLRQRHDRSHSARRGHAAGQPVFLGLGKHRQQRQPRSLHARPERKSARHSAERRRRQFGG